MLPPQHAKPARAGGLGAVHLQMQRKILRRGLEGTQGLTDVVEGLDDFVQTHDLQNLVQSG